MCGFKDGGVGSSVRPPILVEISQQLFNRWAWSLPDIYDPQKMKRKDFGDPLII